MLISPVNIEKAFSTPNISIEELTYEEQQTLKQYEYQMSEEELYIMER